MLPVLPESLNITDGMVIKTDNLIMHTYRVYTVVCNNWDACLLPPTVVAVFFCCSWWALIEGTVLMELVVTVSAVVAGFVPMLRVAIEADTSGTAGSTVDGLGCTAAATGSVGVAGVLLKSFDCHCGVEPE